MASSTLSAGQRDAARRRGEIASDYKLGTSRTKQDYRYTTAALGRALKQDVQGTNDDFSSRGLFDSGIRKQSIADLGTDYTNNMSLALQARNRELENLTRAKSKGTAGVNTGLESSLFGSVGESLSSILQRALNESRNRFR